MLNELLPVGANKMAEQSAAVLGVSLEPDLVKFLQDASRIPGLQAVGLVVRHEPGIMRHLGVYGFTDLSHLNEAGSVVSQTVSRFSELIDILDEAVRRPGRRRKITDGSSFVNTAGTSLEDAIHQFSQYLENEPKIVYATLGLNTLRVI